MSYWYCNECKCERSPNRVTYEEKCDTCGHPAIWVETEEYESIESMLQELNERRTADATRKESLPVDPLDIKAQLRLVRDRCPEVWEKVNFVFMKKCPAVCGAVICDNLIVSNGIRKYYFDCAEKYKECWNKALEGDE